MAQATKMKAPLVPKLRFKEFTGDGEWEAKKIRSILTIGNGRDYKHLKKGNFPVYGTGGYMLSVDGYLHDGTSVCIGRKGTIDKPFILNGKFWTVDTLFYTHSYKKTAPNFVYILFQNINWQNYNAASGVPSLSKDTIYEISIPMPREPEQQHIADCLTSLDENITAESQKLEALSAHKKALMQKLFPAEGEKVPVLRFKEFAGAGEWEEKELSSISDNLDNKRVPITSSERSIGTVPYYGASGVVDYVKDYIFDEELLCISEDGANLITRVCPIAFVINGKTWVNNHAHVLKFNTNALQKITELYINYINIEVFLTGMAQPKLNKAKLDGIPIPLPPTEAEQQRIADCLTSLEEYITAQGRKIALLKEHKKGLLQQLFPRMEE